MLQSLGDIGRVDVAARVSLLATAYKRLNLRSRGVTNGTKQRRKQNDGCNQRIGVREGETCPISSEISSM